MNQKYYHLVLHNVFLKWPGSHPKQMPISSKAEKKINALRYLGDIHAGITAEWSNSS